MAITYNSEVAKTFLSSTSTYIINAWIKENPYGVGSVVDILDGSAASLRTAGSLILNDGKLLNEFCNMVNRIADVMVKAAEFDNPLKDFKVPASKQGAVIEDVFVDLVEPNLYTMDVSADDFFDVSLPEIKNKLHFLNYQTFYKVPISRAEIELAFASEDGVMDLIRKIMGRIQTSAELDEYLAMRYIIARYIADGNAHFEAYDGTPKGLVTMLRAMANNFSFMSDNYNHEMVKRTADRNKLHLLVSGNVDAVVDVDVLAQAYHMEKTDWVGRKHLFDHLAPEPWEYERLEKLFTDHNAIRRFTADEVQLLNSISAIHISDDFFMVADKLTMMDDFKNGQNLFTVYFGHFWKIMSTSPYSVCVVYTDEDAIPAVEEVWIEGPETVVPNTLYHYAAGVEGDAGIDNRVKWSISGNPRVTIDDHGTVIVDRDVSAGNVVITATSVYDPNVSKSVTVTVELPN